MCVCRNWWGEETLLPTIVLRKYVKKPEHIQTTTHVSPFICNIVLAFNSPFIYWAPGRRGVRCSPTHIKLGGVSTYIKLGGA